MKTRTILLALLIAGTPAMSYGQIGSMIKRGASKVLNSTAKAASKEAGREADSIAQAKADKAVENAADSLNTGNQADQGANQKQGGGGGGLGARLFSNEVTAKYKQEYKFSSRMFMQMEMYDKDEVVKMDCSVFYNTNDPSAGMEMKTIAESEGESVPVNTSIIVDGDNKSMLMITDVNGMKIGLISPVPDDSTLKASNTPAKPPKVTKTGNTRVIAGYKCDEYLYQEEGTKEYTKMWLTKDAVLKIDKNAWSKAGMPLAYGYSGFEGMVNMAWEAYDDKNKLATKSEVKEININYPHSMSVAGTTFRQVDFAKMAADQNKKK